MALGDLIATVSELLSGVVGAAASIAAVVLTGIAVFKKNAQGNYMIPDGSKERKMLIWAFALEIVVMTAGLLALMVNAGWFGARGRARVYNTAGAGSLAALFA
jgi:hypothetical protein